MSNTALIALATLAAFALHLACYEPGNRNSQNGDQSGDPSSGEERMALQEHKDKEQLEALRKPGSEEQRRFQRAVKSNPALQPAQEAFRKITGNCGPEDRQRLRDIKRSLEETAWIRTQPTSPTSRYRPWEFEKEILQFLPHLLIHADQLCHRRNGQG